MTSTTTTPPRPPRRPRRPRRNHRLSFVCVNDVYSLDDLDSTFDTTPGGWCRAATLMRSLARDRKSWDGKEGDHRDVCQRDETSDEIYTDDDDGRGEATANNNDNVTVLSVVSGDVLGGSSLLINTRGSVAVDVMNAIPINMACLGNHEFDYGDDELMDRIDESNFAWLGSNVYYPRSSSSGEEEKEEKEEKEEEKEEEKNDVDHPPRRRRPRRLQEIVDRCDEDDHDKFYFPGVYGNGILRPIPNTSIQIGIFGLITNITPQISAPSDRVKFDEDVLRAARRVCRSLRKRGASVIVALTHLREEEDRALAEDAIAGIDLILGGHEHEPLALLVHRRGRNDENENEGVGGGKEEEGYGDDVPKHGGANGVIGKRNGRRRRLDDNDGGGTLVFKTGMNAYWVGTVDLDITIDEDDDVYDDGGCDVITSISTSWSMHAVNSNVPVDPVISNIVERYRKETEAKALITSFGMEIASSLGLDDVVATVASSSTNTNTMLSTTTTTTRSLDTRMSSVRRRESTGGNMVADAMRWMLDLNIGRRDITEVMHEYDNDSSPMLAMINGGFIRGDRLYAPGCAITVRDVLKELPFPRNMSVLIILGKHLRGALAQQLRGSSMGPTGAFPHLSSNAFLRYELGRRSRSDNDTADDSCIIDDGDEFIRVRSFTVDGVEVSDERKYIVAVTSFVAEGSEGCTSWSNGEHLQNPAWDGVNMSCVLLKYLQYRGVINPVLEDRVLLQKD